MNWKEISAGIIGAVVGAGLLTLFGFMGGWIGGELNDEQVEQVASALVSQDERRRVLLDRMVEDGRFLGPRGQQGDQGDRGEQGASGPAPSPTLRFFSLSSARDTPAPENASLGQHQFCTLTRVHLPHASQACGCILDQSAGTWSLDLATDPNARGACRCTAMCVDW